MINFLLLKYIISAGIQQTAGQVYGMVSLDDHK